MDVSIELKAKKNEAIERQEVWNYWHLLEEFLQLQALQSEHEPALPAHTTSSFPGPPQAQAGQTQNPQPS